MGNGRRVFLTNNFLWQKCAVLFAASMPSCASTISLCRLAEGTSRGLVTSSGKDQSEEKEKMLKFRLRVYVREVRTAFWKSGEACRSWAEAALSRFPLERLRTEVMASPPPAAKIENHFPVGIGVGDTGAGIR